ncbi:MAG: 3-oxoacyl-[acyl-carrier-protein] synthase 3 [Acidimicrobiia bacterium]|nr:MAG: 3-oxoacyl-[acyl-carrier-protein] synthase 3 [Acidimicrobiia bacterium]
MTGLPVALAGWGTAVPATRLTNAQLEARVDTSDAWIVERTGIRERRVAGADETTATLATDAAAAAIKRAGLSPTDIDLMIVATASPEQPLPHTGAFVGEALGLRCGSFDLAAACAGFVYELVVGAAMTRIGYERVLVVGAETLSRIVDPEDRTTVVLFGDGAGAAVLTPAAGGEPSLLAWDLGCDGGAAGLLEIPAGGSRRPASARTVAAREHYLRMQGQEVFRRAVRAVVDSASATLARAGLAASEVAWFVPHQANSRIIEAAAQRLGIPPDRTLVNIDRYGNTSSASIPLALFEAVDDGRVRAGDLVLVSGFGAGMTWASALLRWGVR